MALNYNGTEGSSLKQIVVCGEHPAFRVNQAADIDRSKTEASKKIVSPGVHRLPGNVKWVRPHGMW